MKIRITNISSRSCVRVCRRVGTYAFLFAASFCFASCFTGIESTKKIELSKEDKRSLTPSDEEVLMNDISAMKLRDWMPGKRFMASADKTLLIFEQSGLPEAVASGGFAGSELQFSRCETRKALDGSEELLIIFNSGRRQLVFNTHKGKEEAYEKFTSANLPMMIDIDRVEQISSKLKGSTIWTVSSLWYDGNGERKVGKKFIPVEIKGVEAGDSVFPVRISFTPIDRTSVRNGQKGGDSVNLVEGKEWSMLMNYGGEDSGSRQFWSLFSLSDPRLKHKSISDEVWENICSGIVRPGMTKDECRLSLGSPIDTDTGHNYSTLLDIWRYSDGRILRFADGVLVDVLY